MALGVGGFLAAALGMAGAGFGMGAANRKAKMDYETEKFTREAVFNQVMKFFAEGGDITPGMLTSMGIEKKQAENLANNVFGPATAQRRRTIQEGQQQFESTLGRMGFEGFGGPPPAPSGGITPSQVVQSQLQPGGGQPAIPAITPPVNVQPAPPGPGAPAVTAAQEGSQQALQLAPVQPGTGMFLTKPKGPWPLAPRAIAPGVGVSPIPQQAPAPVQPMPTPTPGVQPAPEPAFRPVGVPGGTMTMKVPGTDTTIHFNFDDQNQRNFMSLPKRATFSQSPLEAAEDAARARVKFTPEMQQQYGAGWAAKNFGRIQSRQLEMTQDPVAAFKGTLMEMFQHGYVHPELRAAIAPTQRDVDNLALRAAASLRPEDIVAFARIAPTIWGQISKEAMDQIREVGRETIRQRLAGTPEGQNPAAVAKAIVDAGLGTPDLVAQASRAAAVRPETAAVMAEAGVMPPREAELRPPGAPGAPALQPAPAVPTETPSAPGPAPRPAPAPAPRAGTPAQQAAQIAREEEVKQAARKTAATIIATTRAKAEAHPDELVPENQRPKFVNPTDLSVLKPGSTYKDLQGYSDFTGTPTTLANMGRLRAVIGQMESALPVLKPLYERGAMANVFQRLGVVGGDVVIGPLKVPYLKFPAGALPDSKMIAVIQQSVPGTTPEQAKKIANAIVDIQGMQDTALSILRTAYDEKGNVRGEFIQAGGHVIPSMADNWTTVTRKHRNMVRLADTWERGYSLPGAVAWANPPRDLSR